MTLRIALLLSFLLVGGCTKYSSANILSALTVSSTAKQKELYKDLRKHKKDPLSGIGVLLDAADDARAKLSADPMDALAREDYNFAVARIVDLIDENGLEPWRKPLACPSFASGKTWKLGLKLPDPRPEYHPSNFEIHAADRYKFKGELVEDVEIKQGLGAPVIVVGRDLDFTKIDKFAQGKKLFYGLTGIVRFDGSDCSIEYHDPLDEETVTFENQTFSLAGDWQSPLSLLLASFDVKKIERERLLRPDTTEFKARLGRLQPYDPDKIPILCVHGFGNSPATWVPLINYLRSDPSIRRNYQFWFFSYPTGLPYPAAAANLRKQLGEIAGRYPEKKDMVVIGHSMGGMISRLLITDSGMTFWDDTFDVPPEELPVQPQTRELLKEVLIFKSRDDISRILFVSTSHRGVDYAANFIGRLGSKLVGDPIGDSMITEEVLAYASQKPNQRVLKRLPNSIDALNPDDQFVQLVDTLPTRPDVPFHSLIGDRGKGGNLDKTKPQSTDGVVAYWSSHMDGAISELIIPSEHWSHLHPQGKAEIKRVLLYHLDQ